MWASGQLPSPVLCLLAAFHPLGLFAAHQVMTKTATTKTISTLCVCCTARYGQNTEYCNNNKNSWNNTPENTIDFKGQIRRELCGLFSKSISLVRPSCLKRSNLLTIIFQGETCFTNYCWKLYLNMVNDRIAHQRGRTPVCQSTTCLFRRMLAGEPLRQGVAHLLRISWGTLWGTS